MAISIDLNRLTYGEYRQFLAGELDEIQLLSKVVVAWSFEGDPATVASYDQLGMVDLLTVQDTLRNAIKEATSGN